MVHNDDQDDTLPAELRAFIVRQLASMLVEEYNRLDAYGPQKGHEQEEP